MAHDHIVEMFKADLVEKLTKLKRVAFDQAIYDFANKRFCLRRRRTEKGINELVEEGKIKLIPGSSRYENALDIILADQVQVQVKVKQ